MIFTSEPLRLEKKKTVFFSSELFTWTLKIYYMFIYLYYGKLTYTFKPITCEHILIWFNIDVLITT